MMDRIIFFHLVANPINLYTGCPVVSDFWIRQDKSKLTSNCRVAWLGVSTETPVGFY
jgi:hypothetical protein